MKYCNFYFVEPQILCFRTSALILWCCCERDSNWTVKLQTNEMRKRCGVKKNICNATQTTNVCFGKMLFMPVELIFICILWLLDFFISTCLKYCSPFTRLWIVIILGICHFFGWIFALRCLAACLAVSGFYSRVEFLFMNKCVFSFEFLFACFICVFPSSSSFGWCDDVTMSSSSSSSSSILIVSQWCLLHKCGAFFLLLISKDWHER